jgi:hypothetical protein
VHVGKRSTTAQRKKNQSRIFQSQFCGSFLIVDNRCDLKDLRCTNGHELHVANDSSSTDSLDVERHFHNVILDEKEA